MELEKMENDISNKLKVDFQISTIEKPVTALSKRIDLDIDELNGTEKDRKMFKGKIPKKLEFSGLKIFSPKYSFEKWWMNFKFAIKTSGLVGFVKQIQFSFSSHMDYSIQRHFAEFTDQDTLDLKTMVTNVLSLYDKGSKQNGIMQKN